MQNYNLTHLQQLESEAIFILRETAAQFERPGLLFSGGKDSIVMAHLAYKAFHPSKVPFPFVHVDTGHNFPETIEFRDEFISKLGLQLLVGSVQESIDKGTAVEEKGPNASRNALQSVTLLETIENESLDACLGGGRRDEEKARAKERFFRIATLLVNGTLKINARSYGICLMVARVQGRTFVSSHLVIGRKWMFGNIRNWKVSNCPVFTLPMKEKFSFEMALCLRLQTLSPHRKMKRFQGKP